MIQKGRSAFLTLALCGGLAGAIFLQGIHAHDAHEAGLYAPHVDCVVCSYGHRSISVASAPPTSSARSIQVERLTFTTDALIVVHVPHRFPYGRAPPFASF